MLNGQDVKMAARYNAGQPADDRDSFFVEEWSHVLEQSGGYAPAEARAAVLSVFPDILQYDRTMPATYPNGRVPTDDVFDARLSFIGHGKITSDGVAPHTDLLSECPFPRRTEPVGSVGHPTDEFTGVRGGPVGSRL